MTPIVLLVDDGEEDVYFAKLALARSNIPHRLVVCRDGDEALAWLRTTGAEPGAEFPAVILLDLNLPGLSGHDVLREIRREPRTAPLPVVVLSSTDDEDEVARAYHGGAQSFFQKCLDFNEFASSVSVLAHYWLELNVCRYRAGVAYPGGATDAGPARLPPPRVRPSVGALGEYRARLYRPHAPVVVVDGDPVHRERTVAGVRSRAPSRRVLPVGSGEEACQLLLAEGICGGPHPLGCPGLVLLELDLPDSDGVEVLRRVRASVDHRVTLVGFTARGTPATVAECYRLGINGIVPKPEDETDHRDAAAVITHYWLDLSRPPPAPKLPEPRAQNQ